MQALRSFAVTIRVFDPALGLESGESYVLPVDSPDAEHACASTLANAASFVPKTRDDRAAPIAFCAIAVRERTGPAG